MCRYATGVYRASAFLRRAWTDGCYKL
ncbi:unnamed protein product [Acanthoscelides obtectus]|uniref:Uncharacterized protein n=1 Tax=Acanthoscelides obtectus TaxID=200917 RepID=A0A9P0PYB9_ACAOB|nr:unnamed protein product [Acanthoscelides obtectus]CAK1665046.1 hypothetical protein AOBTE_LOCUS24627 [Acanthoscelides obtectus]